MLLLSSCATTRGPSAVVAGPELFVEAAINEDAGCGSSLIVAVRTEDGRVWKPFDFCNPPGLVLWIAAGHVRLVRQRDLFMTHPACKT